MTYPLHQIPLFKELESCENILVAGAGGGFDIYSGIPVILNLLGQGKTVVLGNFSFTKLRGTGSQEVHPHCFQIEAGDHGKGYFPEKHLKA